MNSGTQKVGIANKIRAWKSRLAAIATGLFIFLSVSGISIYLLPFSRTNQFMVLFHTLIGLIFVLPYAVYQWRHYLYSRQFKLTYVKLLGYSAFLGISICLLSGVVLTWQSAYYTRIDYTWDLVHTVTGFVSAFLVIPHIVVLVIRYTGVADKITAREMSQTIKGFGVGTGLLTVVLTALVVLMAYSYTPVTFKNEFPPDYNFKYADKPFRPSLATTATGGAFDPRSMAESQSCGVAGCHEQIYEEWLPSAHRYASMEPGFQAVQMTMAKNNGPESTRYCAGCHDPIALFSGSKNLYTDDLSSYGADEGVSCVACHSIQTTDVKGNASYIITQPERYIYELKEGKAAEFISRFLIRAYPRKHIESYTRDLYKTSEYCGACHKQFIDETINNVGWVQLQNQYDNWRKSRWYTEGDPAKTITCRECHMYLNSSSDPASGDVPDYNRTPDDGKHRSHRFIASNQFMPTILKLPGAEEHVRLTEEWLRGETPIPEIADKWVEGPAVPVEIIAPETVSYGDEVAVKVSILNNKVGHDFPTGPLDIIQVWVDLSVEDQNGNLIYNSGKLNERNFIQEGSFVFKAEGIDQYGNLIDRHNLWDMVGARFKRALFPGFSDVAEYRFLCPSVFRRTGSSLPSMSEFQFNIPDEYVGALTITARLQYRKVNQYLLNILFGEEAGLTAPITEMSKDKKVIWVKKPMKVANLQQEKKEFQR